MNHAPLGLRKKKICPELLIQVIGEYWPDLQAISVFVRYSPSALRHQGHNIFYSRLGVQFPTSS